MKYDDNFEKVIKYLFESEGGYVNDKDDRGGQTNYGVTQATYDSWRKQKGLPIKDVKNITKDEAKKLYYEEFWKGTGASEVKDLREAYLLFDTAIICGPYNAQKMYKRAGGNIYQFLKERAKFHNVDIKKNPEQEKFKEGWFNRLKDLENNMNEIVNKRYYVPPYQNEITPFDKEYNGPLKKIDTSNMSDKDIQSIRNKYLYLLNKNYEKNNQQNGKPTGQAAPISNLIKSTPVTQPTVKTDKPQTPSQKFSDEIRAKFRAKNSETNKRLNRILNFHSSNANFENGHWVTMNGAHVFIKDN